MRVLVTRPAAQAAGWVERLAGQGIEAVALPLIAIEGPPDPAAVEAAWRGLDARALAVFVSPNAVERFFAARPPGCAWPAGLRAGAPGPGTGAALRAAGVPASAIVEPAADAASFDSESLWAALGPAAPVARVASAATLAHVESDSAAEREAARPCASAGSSASAASTAPTASTATTTLTATPATPATRATRATPATAATAATAAATGSAASAAMLAPQPSSLASPWQGASVLVVRGGGAEESSPLGRGREWLARTLREAGATVDFVVAYRRGAARFGAVEQAAWARALAAPQEHVWLFSSSEAIDQLAALLPARRAAAWTGWRALATHPRIAERARAAGFGRVVQSAPRLEDVAAALRTLETPSIESPAP